MSEYDGKQFVGIDLHRSRSVIVRMTAAGERLDAVRVVNDPMALMAEVAKAGRAPEVVLEATYGWYWAADALAEAGANVHLAHPLGIKGFATRRVKNDYRDAADLADLLRMGRLPEAWIAPPAVRELRELVRYRCRLVGLRSGLKASVHGVLAKQGLRLPVTDLFGVRGRALLAAAPLEPVFRARVNSLCRLVDEFGFEIGTVTGLVLRRAARDPGWAVIQQVPGIGPILAAVIVAEIGDVHRFAGPRQLCSWAGLTPGITSPTAPCGAGTSPNRARGCCGGRWSRPPRRPPPARGGWSPPATASASAAAAASRPSRWPAGCSPWSTTACATGTSAR
ncbi:IS110 family RNA-guided transposase [Lentzea nigeriaca]|nr:IS110 family transposase [Lentzea nigeriaca]MBM7859246.1 transposase [Lentzea nigeriaca]